MTHGTMTHGTIALTDWGTTTPAPSLPTPPVGRPRSPWPAAAVLLALSAPALAQDPPGEDGDALPDRAQTWRCVTGEVEYAITVAPDSLEAEIEVRVGEAGNAPLFRDYAIGAVAPFPRFDYSDGNDRFYRTADGAFFISAGEDPIACEPPPPFPDVLDPNEPLDIPGASLGGRLRAGPGTEFAPLGLLAPGAPLTLVTATDVEMDDFLWYAVRIDGTTLYHWGGIMCAERYALPGLAGRCEDVLPDVLGDTVFRSRGGNVRSGPGTGFEEVGTVPAGAPLSLIANTGVELDGQPWFEIAFEDASAYHWGGLICTEGETGGTAFEPC